LQSPFA